MNKTDKELKEIDDKLFKIDDAFGMINQCKEISAQIQEELDKIKRFEDEHNLSETASVFRWYEFFDDEYECPIGTDVLITTYMGEVLIDKLELDKKTYKMSFKNGDPGKEVIAWAFKPQPYKKTGGEFAF